MTRAFCGRRQGPDAGAAQLAERLGFSSAPQMERLFTGAYGSDLQAYRDAIGQRSRDDPDPARRRWNGWLTDLD